jgi:hypothetical protein
MTAEKPICPLCDARAKLEKATMLAGELIATIRVNAMRGTFATATVEQIEEFIAPRIEQLKAIQGEHHFRGATEKVCETNAESIHPESKP